MKVEIQWRWLAVFLSVVVLVVLRNHKVWLITYSTVVLAAVVAALVLLPRLVDRAERNFTRLALGRLTAGDAAGLAALAEQQRLLRLTGRAWVIDETLGRGALAQRDGEGARAHFTRAAAAAPATRRAHVELALAEAELLTGAHDAAEGRLRALLGTPRPTVDARPLLAKVLLARGASAGAEAAALLRAALPDAAPHTQGALRGQLALALAMSGDAGWASALAEARASGASDSLCAEAESAAAARGLAA